jgi:23S rRNA (guanosine2251-2'-O)-methyltransferase
MMIYGLHAVLEAVRAGRVRRLQIGARADRRIEDVVAAARSRGIPVERVDERALERAAGARAHQGVVAELTPARDVSLEDVVAAASPGSPLLLVLDGIEDPHNLGAILRTADAAGCHGVVRQARHAAPLEGAAMKASAGAAAHVRVVTVVNIARALQELHAAGVWTVGLAGEAPERYHDVDLTLPTALVVGAEGAGLRRLVRERCDRVVSIPMQGAVASLNASVAAGIVLFEALRQRWMARAKALC